jgi:lipopolysaccharide/colanic/teichoic acid biosynthesis glycosyltransferase
VGFDIVKFRTMHARAEHDLRSLPELHAAYLAGGYKLPSGADPRLTAVGRVLRRLDLDELPQLWNVVKGDMSLVGPRPVLESELARHYGPARRWYEQVRPGMTGLWQVSGRNRLDYARRVALDVDYVLRLSVRRDLAILARTAAAVLHGGGGPGRGALGAGAPGGAVAVAALQHSIPSTQRS